MTPWSVVLIAVGVSADAFAVAVGKGVQLRRLTWRCTLRIAGTFALFQMAMPLLGWLVGRELSGAIVQVDHWIAFVLLAAIGGKMVWEAFQDDDAAAEVDLVAWRELVVLGIATSIDALAVGLSLALLSVPIVPAVAVIGATTLVLSACGVWLGHQAGLRWRRPAEVAGGLLLIAIGTKILGEHLGWW